MYLFGQFPFLASMNLLNFENYSKKINNLLISSNF